MNKKIAFIGSGNMGSALIRAASRALNPQQIYITDYDLAKASSLARETGCQTAATNADAAGLGDFIFLCVKPQIIGDVLHEISPYLNRQCEAGKEKVLISIAAGLTIETLRQKLDGACRRLPFVRIMPNTPAAIGKGMLAMAFGPEVSEDILADLELVLFRAGRIERLSETMMDAFTTVSGCAPAFAYLFIEALADGAVLTGLSRHQALTYAAQAVLGAAAMVLETGRHPGELKDAVCSPKGSTIAGVSALERNGFRSAAIEAITDAYQKNTELGKIG